jgi:long-chain acyl-CoA synthetase
MLVTRDKLKFVEHRVRLTKDEPTTLVELYEQVARDHPKLDTLNYKSDDRWNSISSDKMLQRARNIALGLYSLGIRKGDRVALLSDSCAEWVLADQGCMFAGAIPVPIYPTLSAPQIAYIINDCSARALFVSTGAKLEQIKDAVHDSPSLTQFILFVDGDNTSEKILTLLELENRGRSLSEQNAELINELARASRPDDLATIIYTSGTTGEPKGVMLTHSNMVSNVIDSSNHLEFGERDRALSVLPLSHSFERQAMNMYLHHGMSVYFGSLDSLGEYLREVHPTVFVGVPRIYEKILARVLDRAAAKGKLNTALVTWAIEVGKQWARLVTAHLRVPWPLSLKRRLADLLIFEKLRKAMGGRIRGTGICGRRTADCARLRFDRNVASSHGWSTSRQSHRHRRQTDPQRRSPHRRGWRD